ncbi:hypothetical protein KJ359_013101 [Pestalotiopsis sp. 9143b]|nr:hypothetical protein KJ359_013101 [Pestalotiopsis sp. 9143b]
MSALLPLAGFWAWNQAEKALARRALAAYQPVPISANPEYLPSDVTVLVCTVNTLLARCLRTWLANDPLEVIIVTIAEHEEQIRSVVANAELSESDLAKVTVLVSEIKGKRMQTITGLAHVHGSIIANVDDHITWYPEFLKHMLPCFDNERVGAASPTIEAIIPEHRRDPNVITPYEAAAMRVIWERTPRQKVAWSTARWIFGLTGVTYLMRADIMKDPEFIEAYAGDNWQGKKMDVGEDTFVTRWAQSHDWVIMLQSMPETDVYRTVKTNSDYFSQMFRWERSTIQSHIRQTQLSRTYESMWVARKTWGRVLRPVFTTLWMSAWILAFMNHPGLTLLFVVWYIVQSVPSYMAFFAKYPYMRRYWWAVVAQDFFYIVQDYYCWLTLRNTSWESRTVSAEDQARLR